MTVRTPPTGAARDEILDLVAVLFGQVLRRAGIAASPAEVIEIRRTLAIVGTADLAVLRPALRSVSVKYGYETAGFEHAFDVFFLGADTGPDREEDLPRPRGAAADLPDDVVWDDEFDGAARRIGADEHTDEIGDLMAPDPDAGERHGESAHREENDFTVSAGAEQLGVDPDSGSVSGGVTYTVEIDSADSASVGELTGAAARVASTPLGVTGAAAILAALDAYDPWGAYGSEGNADLDDARRIELEHALAAFVDAFTARLEAAGLTEDDAPGRSAPVRTEQADIDRACHRLVQRMRGAPRRVIGRGDRGTLDIRATMRAAVATDGVPAELWRRRPRPGPVRLLVLVDVSLSVRPVTGFILRLAQTLHRFGDGARSSPSSTGRCASPPRSGRRPPTPRWPLCSPPTASTWPRRATTDGCSPDCSAISATSSLRVPRCSSSATRAATDSTPAPTWSPRSAGAHTASPG
ncbi:hypothetical protein GOAMI_28_00860 [Gordonia amicalis NBRC 100051 = JCM 11271]|nr:hypothetical protein GOAMI_28_00860 [Gordonia amicalis NBRC 100051 = JCM 11271]